MPRTVGLLLVLVCLAGVQPAAGDDASFQDWLMAKSVPGGSRCVPPAATTTFFTTDAVATVWFLVDGMNVGDEATAKWFSPDGALYATYDWAAVAAPGSGCLSESMDIAGNPPASLPGPWTVKVYWNGSLKLTLPFTVTPRTLSAVGSVPQLVSAGGWDTSLTLLSLGGPPAQVSLDSFRDDGSRLSLPYTFPQSPSASTQRADALRSTLNTRALLTLDTTGPESEAAGVGWAELLAAGSAGGFAILKYTPTGRETVVPLETRDAGSYVLAFDNTGVLATGLAIANLATSPAKAGVVIRDETGAQIGTGSISLRAQGDNSFVLTDSTYGFPITANKRGTVELDTPQGGRISVFGLRANGAALTSLPVLANVGTTGGTMAQVASGGGWETLFTLVNTGATPANATLRFFADGGSALSLPLDFPQTGTTATESSVSQEIPGGATLVIVTQGQSSGSLLTGWAQLTTNGQVSGFGILQNTADGQEAVVPLEMRNADAYALAFDNTNGLTTGLALANVSNQAEGVPMFLRDDTGAILGQATVNLPPWGHTSLMLSDNYSVTAGKRGTVEFDTPAGGQISALGLYATLGGVVTTIPALVTTPTSGGTPPPGEVGLVVLTTGTGSGTVAANPPGPTYPGSTTVTLTAVPSAGSAFAGWSGACWGTDPCAVAVAPWQSARPVTATFARASQEELVKADSTAAITSVLVAGTTATQVVLEYTAPNTGTCTVAVSQSATLSPLVPDVDPALFVGANQDNRAGSISGGLQRVFVAGKRAAELGVDGRYHSRALQAHTPHYYQITCGTNTATGTFETMNIPIGATSPEVYPVDPVNPGNYAWPNMNQSITTGELIVDPLTGALLRRITGANTVTDTTYTALPSLGAFDDSGSANPWSITGTGGAALPATYTANGTASPTHLYVPANLSTAKVFSPKVSTPETVNWVQVSITGAAKGSGNDAILNVCLTIDGVTCAAGSPNSSTSPLSVTLSSTSGTESLPPTTGTTPAAYLSDWFGWAVPPFNTTDIATRPITASYNSGTGALTWTGSNYFDRHWTTGTRVWIGGAPYKLASYTDSEHVGLAAGLGIGTTGIAVTGQSFGVLIWKKTNTSGTAISISNVTFSVGPSEGEDVSFWNGGYMRQCNPNAVPISCSNCGPSGTAVNESGFYCQLYGANGFAWIGSTTGTVLHLGAMSTAYTLGTGGNGWNSDSFYNLGNYVYDPTRPASSYFVVSEPLAGVTASALGRVDYTGSNTDIPSFGKGAPMAQTIPAANLTPYCVNGGAGSGICGSVTWARSHSYSVGTLVIDPAGHYQKVSTAGTSGTSTPVWTDSGGTTTDGTITWTDNGLPVHYSLEYLLHRFDSRFPDPSLGSSPGCGLVGQHTGTLLGQCDAQQNEAPAFVFALDPTIAAGPTTSPVIAMMDMTNVGNAVPYTNAGTCTPSAGNCISNPIRWCQIHATDAANYPWFKVSFEQDQPTTGYQTTLNGAITSTATTINVNGDPGADIARVGDLITIDSETMQIIGITVSGATWTVSRAYNVSNTSTPSRAAAHSNGAPVLMTCGGSGKGPLAWDYIDDPHGLNASGTTVLQDPPMDTGHSGWSAWNSFVRIVAQDEDPLCTTELNLQECFENRIGAAPGSFGQPPTIFVNDTPTFTSVVTRPYSYTENHPSQVQEAAASWNENWFTDSRPMIFGAGGYAESSISNVTGSLYVTSQALHPRQVPTIASCGEHPLLDISPGPIDGTSAHNWEYCTGSTNCYSGATASETYVNCPDRTLIGCLNSETSSGADPNGDLSEDICIGDAQFGLGSPLVQIDAMHTDGQGRYQRVITYGLMRHKHQMQDYIANGKALPDGSWATFAAPWVDEQRSELFLAQLPPWPAGDSINRGTFEPLPIQLGSVPAGTNNAIVQFGYNPSFYCTSRQEACTANQSTVNETTPFYWASETYSGLPCASGCTVTVPAIPQRVVYYRVQYRTASGSVLATSATSAAVVP